MKKLITFFAAVLLSSIGLHAERAITYYSFNRLYYKNGSLDIGATTFGPAITNHDFSYGVGTIVCNGEITKIGTEAFFECSNLDSIEIPSSVITIEQSAFDRCNNLKKVTMSGSVTSIGSWAFDACSALTSIVIPNSVTTIGAGAFNGCNNLTSVTIGSSVTSIKSEAFAGCKGLTSIEIPNSVVSIGDWTFNGCSGLTTVKMNWTDAQSIASISSNVFQRIARGAGPQGAKLYVPAGTYNLYHQADVWKDFGVIVDTDNKITYTASAQLTGAQFNVGATTFGSGIFSHTFSNGTGTIVCDGPITTIGANAFLDCHAMTSTVIPNTVTAIEEQAFQNCDGLTSIEIPSSVTTIGYGAFGGCSGLTSIVVENGNTKYDSRDNCNAIVETATNTLILGCKNTKIPNNITTIGRSAFDGCSDLKDITLPNSVTTIGRSAFWNCKSLTSITIPASVKEINEYAFWGCTGLSSVMVSWTDAQLIVSINSNVFQGIANGAGAQGATLVVPRGTTNSYQQANGWKDFGSIVDGDNIIIYAASERLQNAAQSLFIGSTVFGSKIVQYNFSNGVGTIICDGPITKIGEYAFEGCRALTDVTIPTTATMIGEIAFSSCSFTSVVIPAAMKSLGKWAFSGTLLKSMYCFSPIPPKLDGVQIFNGIPTADFSVYVVDVEAYIKSWSSQLPSSCFKPIVIEQDGIKYEVFGGNKARVIAKDGGYTGSITISSQVSYMGYTFTVTEIGQDAFKNCTNLIYITIPNTITTIGIRAFEGCSNLTSVIIPASVKEIKDWAFKNCTQLNDLQFAERERTDAITIGTYAIENTALEAVAIPEWMAVVPEGLFYSNKKLRAIYLPANVNHINQRAFEWCDSVKCVVSMAATPPTLDANAFVNFKGKNDVFLYVPSPDAITAYKNSNWDSYFPSFTTDIEYNIISTTDKTAEVIRAIPFDGKVAIPAMAVINGDYYTVIGIGNNAFKNDTSLRSISLPPSIQYIGNDAFNGCTQLKQTSIETLEDLQTIGYYAFYGCSALDSIVIPEGVQTLDAYTFYGCKSLTNVVMPVGLRKIWDGCFWESNLQQEITIPEGVDTIGQKAFCGNTKLEIINLPSTLKEIKSNAFDWCNAVKEVTCLAVAPPNLGNGVFSNKDTAIVYVPNRDVLQPYKNSSWKNYKFKFSDLMAEQNKKYLYVVAGENKQAQDIAKLYCDSIDRHATTAQQVQDYTNRALEKIDKLTLVDYKQALADSLERHAGNNAEAKQIAGQYVPQIINAYFRDVAERIFTEADKKIGAIFELIALKEQYCTQLKNTAKGDPDMEKVADSYSTLIRLAETKEEARALYDRATMRMTINRQINTDWQGVRIKVNNHECTTTRGYIYY